jgi:hypothetical protein
VCNVEQATVRKVVAAPTEIGSFHQILFWSCQQSVQARTVEVEEEGSRFEVSVQPLVEVNGRNSKSFAFFRFFFWRVRNERQKREDFFFLFPTYLSSARCGAAQLFFLQPESQSPQGKGKEKIRKREKKSKKERKKYLSNKEVNNFFGESKSSLLQL